MEDKELFELCKQVYEATEWKETLQFFNQLDLEVYSEGEYEDYGMSYSFKDGDTPLYTSDYILEKLPEESVVRRHYLCTGQEWQAESALASPTTYYANTPLKALLKLTLALHDAGELK